MTATPRDFQLTHQRKQPVDVLAAKHGGWLVEDHDPRPPVRRFGDFDHLAVGDVERGDTLADRKMEPHPGEQLLRIGMQLLLVERPFHSAQLDTSNYRRFDTRQGRFKGRNGVDRGESRGFDRGG